MMTKEVYQNCNFHNPWGRVLALGCGHISHIVEMHFSYKKSVLPGINQTNYVYRNDDQGRVYQNCKFHDPQGWGSDVRRGHISH